MEQLSRCEVKLRHNYKWVKCRFFVVPGDGAALLRMSDIEFLGIIRVMCETDNKAMDRKFVMKTRHAADSHNCKTKGDLQEGKAEDKTNIPDYLNSSTSKTHVTDYFNFSNNKETDKGVSEAIVFSGIGCFEGTFSLQIKRGHLSISAMTKKSRLCAAKPLK